MANIVHHEEMPSLPLKLGESFSFELMRHLEDVVARADWPESERDEFKMLTARIADAITAYSDGWPDRAYDYLKQAFADFHQKIPSDELSGPFFRMRVAATQPLSSEDMFHIPFEKRRLVAPQRFSILGLPCLYTARSLYVCWEELRRPPLNSVHVCALRPHRLTRVLQLSGDLRDPRSRVFYPLAAACSVRTHEDSAFRPEHVVPQLLLQWFSQESDLDGIVYVSTHVSHRNDPHLSQNVVFPVRHVATTGFCRHLSSLFEITEPMSWEFVVNSGMTEGVHRPGGTFYLGEAELKYDPTMFAFVESVLNQQSSRRVSF